MAQSTQEGIPTTYNGIDFRSRGEARWASLFDHIGWEWEYEPVDANYYIPDFLIKGPSPFFVEVKYAIKEIEYQQAIPKAVAGLARRWNHDLLVVGADVVLRDDTAGVLLDFLHGPNDWNTTPARWVYCPSCVSLGIASDNTGGHMRPCGHDAPEGGNPAGEHPRNLWKFATNAVRWKR